MDIIYSFIESVKIPEPPSGIDLENEKRILHVKSDHELFLIKDLTEEVTKIINRSKETKAEFERVYASLLPRNRMSESDFSDLERSDFTGNKDYLGKIQNFKYLMNNMDGFVDHLERLFNELIDRSATIIDNSDLIEKNYTRLLNITNGKSDQKRMVDEMHALNQDNLRTIMKLRKEIISLKSSKDNIVPQLQLDKIDNGIRPHSVTESKIPLYESPRQQMSASVKANMDKDTFLSQKLQEAERRMERLSSVINEKESIIQALENENMRKDQTIQRIHSTYETTQNIEQNDKQDLNIEIERLRREYQKQIEDLNYQLDHKCREIQNLVNELNNKDNLLRDNSKQIQGDYDTQKILDDNKRLYREVMVIKDEVNQNKLKINQQFNEIESYKSSIQSLETHCDKLKNLNTELNKTLAEERDMSMRGRDRVHEQMEKMSNRVNELEDVSESIENSKRDFHKKSDYLIQRFLDLRDYVITSDMHTSRTNNAAPGTVRNNLSQIFSSVSKNPMEINNCEENVEEIMRDIKSRFDNLKYKITNYQTAINKLQGEKQQLYQSVTQLKVDRSHNFQSPTTIAPNTSIKENPVSDSDEKSETMIEYLRTEISLLRKKNQENEMDKRNKKIEISENFNKFMAEIFRPGKDLIYQLCTDPHLSEGFFYKDDPKFKGLDPKYCLDVAKMFDLANEKMVDLKTVLDHKEQVIRELDRKFIELKMRYNQQEQVKRDQEVTRNTEIKQNFVDVEKKCQDFANNFNVLKSKLENQKNKSERLEKENQYLKDHIKSKNDTLENQELLKSNLETRIRLAKEEGIRQGRKEGIMDSKMNEIIAKYKQDIGNQTEKILELENSNERLKKEVDRLEKQAKKAAEQLVSERNLQQSLSKEIEQLTMEVKALKQRDEEYE